MLRTFIHVNDLKEADVVIAKKRGWGIFDHFIIYMGKMNGQHFFIANDANGGVRWFSESEIIELIMDFTPTSIRKFNGDFFQRKNALNRAKNELGKSYSLTNFNCEHLANYVQYGVKESKQVENWSVGLSLLGVFVVAACIFKD